MPKRIVPVVVIVCLMPALASSQVRVGPEFRVNGHTTGSQAHSSVTATPNGGFVVAWQSAGQDGSGYGVFARRYDALGAAMGAEFQVNAYATGDQTSPSVAADPDGRLVIAWTSNGQDRSGSGVFARRYDTAGVPGAEFRVNSHTTSSQADLSVAAMGGGAFVVVWTSDGQDGNGAGIVGQRYDAAGVPQFGEFLINTYTYHYQFQPRVAAAAGGGFVVVWTGFTAESRVHIIGQRHDAAGGRLGGEFQVSEYDGPQNEQNLPAVASDAGGRFVVAWRGDWYTVRGRRYDAGGVALGGPFDANTTPISFQYDVRPTLAVDANGDFMMAWKDWGEECGGCQGFPCACPDHGIFAQRYDVSGVRQGGQFAVNGYTTGEQGLPAIASDGSGTYLVTWTSSHDGDGNGVFGQRFRPDLIFRDGFESGDLSAWSANATGSGDLRASEAAAIGHGDNGLEGEVNDTAGLYVADETPADEPRYRARFHFDTNRFDPGEAAGHYRTRLFIAFEEAPTRRLVAIVLRRQQDAYALMGRARLDDGSQANTGFFPIAEGAHTVEMDWTRSSGPDANDGSLHLWIDGDERDPVAVLTGLDNHLSAVDFARLGALSVKVGAAGLLYWDEFESRRESYIGP
jgi:hypothetical protein